MSSRSTTSGCFMPPSGMGHVRYLSLSWHRLLLSSSALNQWHSPWQSAFRRPEQLAAFGAFAAFAAFGAFGALAALG